MTTSHSIPNTTARLNGMRFLIVITVLFAGIATTGCDTAGPDQNGIIDMPAPDNRQDFFPLAVGNTWTFADTSSSRATDHAFPDCIYQTIIPTTKTEGLLTWSITEALSDSMGYRVETLFTGQQIRNKAVAVIDPVYMVETGECVEEWAEEPLEYTASFEIKTTADSLYVDGLTLARLQEVGTDTLSVSVSEGDLLYDNYKRNCLWNMVEDVGVVEKFCSSEDFRATINEHKMTLLEYVHISEHSEH